MPGEIAYCETCWTNPAHAYIRATPICSQCITEFNITRLPRVAYLDELPFVTLDGQRLSEPDAKFSGEYARFQPRSSRELEVAWLNALVGAN
ncbi:hypothetical protein [Paenarthrobacter sp. NPDC090522]|uniref:hypothetical protein n=1 Tax=Paenarthrobacter sp. NPDC090522 TaxID=3364383 RepID=UPI00380C98DA